ncbi:hypothetical protein OG894_41950 (plasmid) [Streptomyces sp. NBC_01724]|uniref:hypothetical protein n=1 Tax=Streptomyces sp. NBC_01724 TaxID=2975922 RepID=UPI002E37A42A|nr:hypothetical protein [Streptomyces sp. NBC_01724]
MAEAAQLHRGDDETPGHRGGVLDVFQECRHAREVLGEPPVSGDCGGLGDARVGLGRLLKGRGITDELVRDPRADADSGEQGPGLGVAIVGRRSGGEVVPVIQIGGGEREDGTAPGRTQQFTQAGSDPLTDGWVAGQQILVDLVEPEHRARLDLWQAREHRIGVAWRDRMP